VSTTIRVSATTKARIDALAATSGRQIQAIVDDAIAEFERSMFFDAVDRRLLALRGEPAEWEALQAERRELDGSLADWARRDAAT
jgi:predicted transcriptional regulator